MVFLCEYCEGDELTACSYEFSVSVRDPKYAVSEMSDEEFAEAVRIRCLQLKSLVDSDLTHTLP